MGAALASRGSGMVMPAEWALMRDQAGVLVGTGFLPATIKTPEQALAVMLKGREIGVPAMYALSNIAVIQGKPACTAELMLALTYRDHGDDAIFFTAASGATATTSYKRRHWRERQTFSFTLDHARTAGLSGGNWAKYPAAMLRARCISAVARMAFPDSISGMYTPEELGASVNGETGEIVGLANGHARLDETEVDSIQGSQRVVVADTGEIVASEPPADPGKRTRYLARIEQYLKELVAREVDVAQFGQLEHDASLAEIEEYGRTLKEALG